MCRIVLNERSKPRAPTVEARTGLKLKYHKSYEAGSLPPLCKHLYKRYHIRTLPHDASSTVSFFYHYLLDILFNVGFIVFIGFLMIIRQTTDYR